MIPHLSCKVEFRPLIKSLVLSLVCSGQILRLCKTFKYSFPRTKPENSPITHLFEFWLISECSECSGNGGISAIVGRREYALGRREALGLLPPNCGISQLSLVSVRLISFWVTCVILVLIRLAGIEFRIQSGFRKDRLFSIPARGGFSFSTACPRSVSGLPARAWFTAAVTSDRWWRGEKFGKERAMRARMSGREAAIMARDIWMAVSMLMAPPK